MVSAGSYILSTIALAALAFSLGFSAFRIRRRLLPDWAGAPARLVESIVAVALLLCLSQLLGTFQLFYPAILLAASLLLAGAIAWRWPGSGASPVGGGGMEGSAPGEGCEGEDPGPSRASIRPPEQRAAQAEPSIPPPGPAGHPLMNLIAIAVVALVCAHWGLTAKDALGRGIFNFDSLWYHMPFAVDMAQSHSVTGLHHTETVFTNWLYPQNSELLHSIGVLFTGRDTLSLFLNFGWLAIAFLAAWCIGRPYGRGALTVISAAVLLECHTLVVREPGSGKNDLMAAALLLAAIAILINAWASRRSQPSDRAGGGLLPGWPLAAAGLAVGLAVGTKSTTLAMAGALTLVAIALAPAGRRWAAAGWWFAPALAGGGFWYLRNLIVVGNPLPQLEALGPLSLPHPEQLQTGRPDFSVIHYATNTGVWSDYFGPGLDQAFGSLWPLVIAVAVGGGALALLRGDDRATRWCGAVALFGMLAYLFTPLTAAGAEGAPTGFAINIRYAVPALLAGAALLPLAPGLQSERRQWALLAGMLLVLVVTDRSDAVLRDPDRVFAVLLAVVLVLVPAGLLVAWRREAMSRRLALAALGALAALVAIAGYSLQRGYLEDRFRNADAETSIPGLGLDRAYRWARGIEDSRVGLAGTTAGFLQYGFYGTDLSNRVLYLGTQGPHGAFNAIPSCPEFREAVNDADLDYLLTAPFLNFIRTKKPIASPEAGWLRGERQVAPIERSGEVTVWRVRGALDAQACGPRNAPLHRVPQQPDA